MADRRLVAWILIGASLAVAVGFGILTFLCGGMEEGMSWDAATNETASYGPRCVSAFHPLVPVWAGFAVLGGIGLASGKAWPALALGAVGFLLGVVSGFSAGFYGLGSGALLLAAGLAARTPSQEVG